jgi:hypothetical protein
MRAFIWKIESTTGLDADVSIDPAVLTEKPEYVHEFPNFRGTYSFRLESLLSEVVIRSFGEHPAKVRKIIMKRTLFRLIRLCAPSPLGYGGKRQQQCYDTRREKSRVLFMGFPSEK